MTHADQFCEFLKAINGLGYAIIRGHRTLPRTPEGDVDMVVHPRDAQDVFRTAENLLVLEREEDHGHGEYAQMLNKAYCTSGEPDPEVTHGKFCIDIASPIFFKSPLKNFTTYWTVPEKYMDLVFRRAVTWSGTNNKGEDILGAPIRIVDGADELTLQILRNTLDLQGQWRDKSKRIVSELVRRVRFSEADMAMAGIPRPKEVLGLLVDGKFSEASELICR